VPTGSSYARISERLSHPLGLLYALFALVLLLGYAVKRTVWTLIAALLASVARVLCCCFFRNKAQIEKERQVAVAVKNAQGIDSYSQDFVAEIRIGPLGDLYKRSVEELARAKKLQKQDMPQESDFEIV